MTSEQTANGPKTSANQTIFFDRFCGIFGTRWREPARCRQPRRDDSLIHAYDFHTEVLRPYRIHLSAPRRALSSDCSSSKLRSRTDLLGLTTTSKPAGSSALARRRSSRILLRILLRSCALPSFRGVVKPKRLCSNAFGNIKTTNDREAFFTPFS